MAKTNSDTELTIEELLEQRTQYEEWLAKLDSSGDKAPPAVRQRIRGDYEARLQASWSSCAAGEPPSAKSSSGITHPRPSSTESGERPKKSWRRPRCVIRSASTPRMSGVG